MPKAVAHNTQSMEVVSIPIDDVSAHPDQPRRNFDPLELERLADSMRRDELLSPIGVRPIEQKASRVKYELIWGERRLRAAQLNGWGSITARVLRVDDQQSLAMLGIENLHRQELNPFEKATYLETLGKSGLDNQKIADLLGYNVSWIQRLRRLLKLPEAFQEWVRSGEWTIDAALRACHPYLETPVVLKAIEEDFRTNRNAWRTRDDCIQRAKYIAKRFDALERNGTAAPNLATPAAAAAHQPASNSPADNSPADNVSRKFRKYLPLFEPFRGNVQVLTTLRDLAQTLIDEAADVA